MPRMINRRISPLPIRHESLTVDRSKLRFGGLVVRFAGHLPGRILFREAARFPYWAFAYIADGEGTYRHGDGPVQQVRKGSLFFVGPGAEYHYGPPPHASWEEYNVTFEGERVAELIGSGLIREGVVLQVGTDPRWERMLGNIMDLMESGVPANADKASLLLQTLLLEFALAHDPENGGVRDGAETALLEEIALHLHEPVDAEKMAKRLGMSVSTLRRQIKSYTGYPLNEYVHRMKIAEAKRRLLNSSASVKEIALSLGYQDVYYFSRLFRKLEGVSASEFRERI